MFNQINMKINGRGLAYFYALVLSLWSIAILNKDFSSAVFFHQNSSEATEKVSSSDQDEVLFLVSHYTVCFQGDANSKMVHLFNNHTFQYLYLNQICATAYSFLQAAEINFEFIDLLYPFHYFW